MIFSKFKTGENSFAYERKAELRMKLILISAGLIFLILILLAIFLKDTEALTQGMEPQEVVTTFYNAFNKYDVHTVRSCIDLQSVNVTNNRLILDLFMGFKLHNADLTHGIPLLDGEGIIYNPTDWLGRGKPQLQWGEKVIGIDSLQIEFLKENVCRVHYFYYVTPPISEALELPSPIKYECTDICTLELYNGNWKIQNIRESSSEAIKA